MLSILHVPGHNLAFSVNSQLVTSASLRPLLNSIHFQSENAAQLVQRLAVLVQVDLWNDFTARSSFLRETYYGTQHKSIILDCGSSFSATITSSWLKFLMSSVLCNTTLNKRIHAVKVSNNAPKTRNSIQKPNNFSFSVSENLIVVFYHNKLRCLRKIVSSRFRKKTNFSKLETWIWRRKR